MALIFSLLTTCSQLCVCVNTARACKHQTVPLRRAHNSCSAASPLSSFFFFFFSVSYFAHRPVHCSISCSSFCIHAAAAFSIRPDSCCWPCARVKWKQARVCMFTCRVNDTDGTWWWILTFAAATGEKVQCCTKSCDWYMMLFVLHSSLKWGCILVSTAAWTNHEQTEFEAQKGSYS